jgi:hypothetical protein
MDTAGLSQLFLMAGECSGEGFDIPVVKSYLQQRSGHVRSIRPAARKGYQGLSRVAAKGSCRLLAPAAEL